MITRNKKIFLYPFLEGLLEREIDIIFFRATPKINFKELFFSLGDALIYLVPSALQQLIVVMKQFKCMALQSHTILGSGTLRS
jgi:hypothetical protein